MELLMGEAVEAFQTRLRELAQQNAELTQIGAWLRQLEKDGDIDLDALGKDTAKRVKALRIKKAEAAVAVAESSLAVVRGEVSKYVELQVRYGSYTSGIKRLKELEQHETQYLEAARARFDTLVKK
ncbi:MAG: hypothetical protein LBC95_01870 [Candidatus Nomurabacteria bacterium]|jgi:hypothetical protein|nr:hypothetical protein [Candidatus Nomurabacteria bacterium]